MSYSRIWKFRIEHILDAIAKIQTYTTDLDEEAFSRSPMVVDAVIRNFQVIGEAARNVPPEVMVAYPVVPWSAMQKMRHVLVHDYDRVDPAVIWRTLKENLPALVPLLEAILNETQAQS